MVARLGSWKDNNLQIKCAKEAVRLVKKYIQDGISFNQETTLCGKSIIKNIILAKEKGFYVVVNYVGVESPEIAKQRVRQRVIKGGHGIADKDIERRYYNSLNNLEEIISICDELNIYDNTNLFKEIISIEANKVTWKSNDIPNWVINIL